MANLKRADAIAVYFRHTGADDLPEDWTEKDLYAWLSTRGYAWRESEYAWVTGFGHGPENHQGISSAQANRVRNKETPLRRTRYKRQVKHDLQPVVDALQQKNKELARELLRPILANHPSADAWVLAAHAAQTREQAILFAKKALRQDPDSERAARLLQQLEQFDKVAKQKVQLSASPQKAKSKPHNFKRKLSFPSLNLHNPRKRRSCPHCGSANIVSIRVHRAGISALMSVMFPPMILILLIGLILEIFRGEFPPANKYICYRCHAEFRIY